jgi:uncharacterized sulfatase
MNGEKGMLSEGGIRVPYLVYWKGTLPAGQVYDHPAISLDVAATAVAVAGQPHDPKLDGVNLIPYLRGEKAGAPHETLYWRWVAQSAAREGKWKYLRGGEREYLFDLEADKEEKRNLLKARPETASRLRAKLERWSSELSPPGLATAPMATTWEAYFDFYLDGKPAPPRPAAGAATTHRARRPDPATVFRRRDRDKDGLLTLQELIGDPDRRDASALSRRFKALDKNSDGRLSFAEFTGKAEKEQ